MTRDSLNELPIPPEVLNRVDPDEVCRVWIAEGESHVVLSGQLLSTPHQWGMLLADIAMHAANATALDHGATITDALKEIEDGYRGRFNETYEMSGRLLRSHQ